MNENDALRLGTYIITGFIGAFVGLSMLIRFIGWVIDPTFKPYKR